MNANTKIGVHRMLGFVKTTLIGGVVFLVPLILLRAAGSRGAAKHFALAPALPNDVLLALVLLATLPPLLPFLSTMLITPAIASEP